MKRATNDNQDDDWFHPEPGFVMECPCGRDHPMEFIIVKAAGPIDETPLHKGERPDALVLIRYPKG